jgi:hypothetical protein
LSEDPHDEMADRVRRLHPSRLLWDRQRRPEPAFDAVIAALRNAFAVRPSLAARDFRRR